LEARFGFGGDEMSQETSDEVAMKMMKQKQGIDLFGLPSSSPSFVHFQFQEAPPFHP
jgi:hypothetical protein